MNYAITPQLSLSSETQPLSSSTLSLSTLPSVTSSVLISEEVLTSNFSSYQQELLPQRHRIGDEAWKLLGGGNPSLAAALLKSIQENSGMVEILFLGKQNFTLCINGEEQYYPYDF